MTSRNMHSKPSQQSRNFAAFGILRLFATRTILCLLVLPATCRLPAQSAAQTGVQSALPAITTARDASRAYPVRLRAVVTFYDEPSHRPASHFRRPPERLAVSCLSRRTAPRR